MLPVFTSSLTAEDYGIQSLLNSSVSVIGALAMLGFLLPLANVFYQHTHHYKMRWRQFYGFLNIWMLFYVLLFGFTVPAYVLFLSYLLMGYGIFLLKDYRKIAIIDFKPYIWLFLTIGSLVFVLMVINLSVLDKIIITTFFVLATLFFYKKYAYKFVTNT